MTQADDHAVPPEVPPFLCSLPAAPASCDGNLDHEFTPKLLRLIESFPHVHAGDEVRRNLRR